MIYCILSLFVINLDTLEEANRFSAKKRNSVTPRNYKSNKPFISNRNFGEPVESIELSSDDDAEVENVSNLTEFDRLFFKNDRN